MTCFQNVFVSIDFVVSFKISVIEMSIHKQQKQKQILLRYCLRTKKKIKATAIFSVWGLGTIYSKIHFIEAATRSVL